METNREKLKRLGIADDADSVMEAACDSVCEVCNREIDKNLSPQNPACEGEWCDEAVELWLDEETKESDEFCLNEENREVG